MAHSDDLTYIGLTTDFTFKRDDNDDLVVFGKATGPDLDLDQQICDPLWLKGAFSEWFETGANVREQHSSIAAGVGLEIEERGEDWFLKSLVVDPLTAKKVEKGVLKGYSIGIKNARIVKDAKAPNGRIVGGLIVETSLVDRPANPTARIEIAKTVGGKMTLVKNFDETSTIVENAIGASEVTEPAKAVCPACNGLGHITDNPETMTKECELCHGSGEAPEDLVAQPERFGNPVENANHDIKAAEGIEPLATDVEKKDYTTDEREGMADKGEAMAGGGFPIKTVKDLKNAIQSIGRAKDRTATIAHIKSRAKALGKSDLIPDDWKAVEHDEATLNSVRAGLIALIKAELDEMLAGEEDETCDVSELLCTLQWFLCWWEGESDESETVAPFKMSDDENEGDDSMAYIGLGVSADIVKAALVADASDDAREALRTETIKALGVDKMIAQVTALSESQEETIKSLKADLEAIREMATPGGPAIRQTKAQAHKSLTAEQMMSDAARLRKTAENLTDPAYRTEYLTKAASLEAQADSLFNN